MDCHSIRLFLGPLFQGKGCCFLGEGTGPLDSSERFYVFFVFHLLVGTKLSFYWLRCPWSCIKYIYIHIYIYVYTWNL